MIYIDNLSLVLLSLIFFVGSCVAFYSKRYLQGDRKLHYYYFRLFLLIQIVAIMVCADHLVLFFLMWLAADYLLTRLMAHKSSWYAAKQSANLALRHFMLGTFFLALAFLYLFSITGSTSIQQILGSEFTALQVIIISTCLALAAMCQSALIPCHRWLISSLNSPTPVSAIMHAGLVNGGGFLLVRFAPIIMQSQGILDTLFVVGLLSAIIGTAFKLLQANIKSMLACSTISQMGFMVAQCGLGLYPAAVAHLCWHGLFKGFLFLRSGSAVSESSKYDRVDPELHHLVIAVGIGCIGALMFATFSQKDILSTNSALFLILVAVIAGAQLSLGLICKGGLSGYFSAVLLTGISGILYGLSVGFIERFIVPGWGSQGGAFNFIHAVSFLILFVLWLTVNSRKLLASSNSALLHRLYVITLNFSQPHAKTVTANRNQYGFQS